MKHARNITGTLVFLALAAFACDSGSESASDGGLDGGDTGAGDADADADADGDADTDGDTDTGGPGACEQFPVDDYELDWASLTPVEPHREEIDGYTVVWLAGTPLEMGQQHGELLHAELQDGIDNSSYVDDIQALLPLAQLLGLVLMAENQSYDWVVQECEGMVETAGDVGWTMPLCLIVNMGDVVLESIPGKASPPGPGCSQFVAAGEATCDGRLYHGRLLDWGMVDHLLDHPVIFVRQPEGGVPHVTIGFPGNLSPYSGMNAAGISIGSNEADPAGSEHSDSAGHSHVQMVGNLLATVDSLQAARDAIEAEDHMSVEGFAIGGGLERQGLAAEMTAALVELREMDDEVVYLTNHFVGETTAGASTPGIGSSQLRYARLEQLLTPADGSFHGFVDQANGVRILRDRFNPYNGEETAAGIFDNNGSLATNGAIYAIVFDPGALRFWVAAGEIPVPEQPYVGFSLAELLGVNDAPVVDPAIIE